MSKSVRIISIFLIVVFAISACNLPSSAPATEEPNAIFTAAALTVQAQLNQATPFSTPTIPPPQPTNTVAVSLPTLSPVASNTPVLSPTAACDSALFVKDVTIPDGTVMDRGEVFTKTWRLQNRGTCTWTPDYYLVFTSGAPTGGTTAVRLPSYVSPGQTVDVSVTLTAPDSLGRQVGYWMLRNPSGTLFGYGSKAEQAFYVDIKVVQERLPHGEVSGSLCYPSEFNPPMTLYFEEKGSGNRIQSSIPEAQNFYSVLLPNGTYYAYAWA